MESFIIQAIGILAVFFSVCALYLKNPRHTLSLLSIKNIFMSIHYAGLGLHQAFIIEILCAFRNQASARLDQKYLKYIIGTFLMFCWGSFLITKPDTFIAFFPAIGTTMTCMACLSRDYVWRFRFFICLSNCMWLLYFMEFFSLAGFIELSLAIIMLALASLRDIGAFSVLRPKRISVAAE